MLGSFWTSRRDTSGGDTTPKAPVHSNPDRERNPFEASLSSSSSSSTGRHSRENSSAAAASGTTTAKDFATPGPLQHSSLNASTTSLSSSHSSSHGHGSGIHSLPAGLRTPTLQKSFVLPEVTSSVNATGFHAPNTSSKTATAALHQSPMYPQSSSGATSTSSGRNTPTRTAHQHTQAAPYPNPKDHQHPHSNTSPKSKSSHPDFKLSQPPDTKNSSSPKNASKLKGEMEQSGPQTSNGDAAPSNPSSTATADPSSNSNTTQHTTINNDTQVASTNMTASTGSSGGSSTGTAQSSARKRENNGSSSLKGKLTVKIIEARNLVTPEANIRPYVVATFEQNEFVSREAINEHEEDARGEAVSPRTSSQLRSSQNAGGPKKNGAENGNGSNGAADAMDTSTASAYHPVWRHEVAL